MDTQKTRINDLTGSIREYIETRIDIAKLDVADAGASAASSMAAWLVISISAVIMLLLVSIGGAIGIGMLLNHAAAGYFIVAGLYLAVSLLVYYNRDKWISKPVINHIVKTIYENE